MDEQHLTLIKVVDANPDNLSKLAEMVKENGIDHIMDRPEVKIESVVLDKDKSVILRSNGQEHNITLEELRNMCETYDDMDSTNVRIFTDSTTTIKSAD